MATFMLLILASLSTIFLETESQEQNPVTSQDSYGNHDYSMSPTENREQYTNIPQQIAQGSKEYGKFSLPYYSIKKTTTYKKIPKKKSQEIHHEKKIASHHYGTEDSDSEADFHKKIEEMNEATYKQFNKFMTKPNFDYIPVNLDANLKNFDHHTFNDFSDAHKTQVVHKKHEHIPHEPEKPKIYATFVPEEGHHSEGLDDYHGYGKGDANSHVKVKNGKVTYNYKIRHIYQHKH